ncbi:MAG TPA: gliding motility-associated C-terminal domain-containing protein [Mucilaginibacter sp.]|nr:gliding motility-associated C-terminal domain-containing protein [Mucilaginibacter sp.]
MRFSRFSFFNCVLLCFIRAQFLHAQAPPAIVAKPAPIILHLDGSGKYTTNISDVATVSGVTDPSTQVSVTPSGFDCSTLGPQIVSVTAVNGSFNAASDANSATFNHPFGITMDGAGNFYVTDQLGNTIRKITPNGTVSTLAGDGKPISADGKGLSAGFDAPSGIVADKTGNLYVTDYNSGLIRKVAPDGTVTTIAGNNMGYAELDGLGTAASFNEPAGIAIDQQGNLYVADQGSSRIRKILPNYLVITIAGSSPGYADGNGTGAHFYGPAGLTVDAGGNLFVTDDYNSRIRKIDPSGHVSTIAGSSTPGSFDGTGASAGFDGIVGITTDGNGNLYVAESGGASKIRKVTGAGVVTTLAGTGMPGYSDNFAAKAQFNEPTGLLFDKKGNLYITDDANNRIRVLTPGGVVSTFAGTSTGADNDGNILPAPALMVTQVQIPVTVESSATLQNNLASGYAIGSGNCGAVLPDYTQQINAHDNCTGAAITFSQSPLPGTSLAAGEKVKVTVSTSSSLLNNMTVTFIVNVTTGSGESPNVKITASAASVCSGNPVTFTAAVQNENPVANYIWRINGIPAGTNSPSFTTTSLQNNDSITCGVSNSVCTTPIFSAPFTITVNQAPTVTFGQNPSILAGQSVRLIPTVTGGDSPFNYVWSPATGLDNLSAEFPVATPGQTTIYQLSVLSSSGCGAVGTVTVTVIRSIIVPSAFTPNGDGINDLWNIKYIDNYPGCIVDIFSRSGQLVFHSIGYARQWDGTFENRVLPSGVYYYRIDLNDGTKKIAGPVTIIR